MNIKVIPVHLELDLKNHEQPLKVQYVVELTTEKYQDVMSTGVTYMADPRISSMVEQLVDLITNTINADLGLQEDTTETKVEPQEEDL